MAQSRERSGTETVVQPRGTHAGMQPVKTDVTWMVGGQQGEGIESTGEIFASTLNRLGYYVYAFRHFASRIKGGHTNYKIRISDQSVYCPSGGVDVLVAFDQESIEHNWRDLEQDGIIIHDADFIPMIPTAGKEEGPHESAKHDAGQPYTAQGHTFYEVPMTKIAKELGMELMKNMVAVGVTAGVLGLTPEDFAPTVEEKFGKKGPKVVESNLAAVRRGFEYFHEHYGAPRHLPPPPATAGAAAHLLMDGNQAIALGALMGGCRLLAAYPITPATPIMYYMIEHLPDFGGVVVQAEDEIAAVNMAIGANYAGVRAMTSTSGPGLALMMEALGLAGMTETPLVVVDVQRAGPSTGLPTKTEQSDLNAMLYGTHGEMPRIVLAPATAEDCFRLGGEAFNLAEKYQCPVIVASDLSLGLSRQTLSRLDREQVAVRRGPHATDEELQRRGRDEFMRYKFTGSGVSPRSVPGQPNGLHLVTGDEHTEWGSITEDPEIRTHMMDKRLHKVTHLDLGELGVYHKGPDHPDLLLAGWGSTFGALDETRRRLEAEGVRAAHCHVRQLFPLPRTTLQPIIEGARLMLVVENNATGQFGGYLRHELCPTKAFESLLKYDGNPFQPYEIYDRCRQILEHGVGEALGGVRR